MNQHDTVAVGGKAPTRTATASPSQRRSIFMVAGGSAIEMYDWAIYATFAPFFATQLFDHTNPQSAFLATLAVFAVGFVARPLGGIVFGWIADRRGRKLAMTTSIALVAFGSIVIGLTPTFESIGLLASVILLIARLLQGLAHGGEVPSAQTYLSEMAPNERRGLWASFIYISGTIGVVVGTLTGAVMTTMLPTEAMQEWGWRIPFLFGGVIGLFVLVMRRNLQESNAFQAAKLETTQSPRGSLFRQIVEHRKQVLLVVGLTVGITVGYYTWAVAAPSIAIAQFGMEPSAALWAGVIGNLVFIAALPFWGRLSDRIGRRPVLAIGLAGPALLQIPMSLLIHDQMWQLVLAMSVMLVLMGGMLAIMPAVFAELFPTAIRTAGVAAPYSIAVALFGGTAPYLNAWMNGAIGQLAFPVYAAILFAISAFCILAVRETKGIELHGSGSH